MKRDRNSEQDLSSSAIMEIVHDIRTSTLSVSETKTEYAKKYPDFAEQYPVLFASVCEPDFDMNRFKYIMGMRDQVRNNEKSLHDASVQVGQRLFDHYVKPHVSETKP